MTEMKNFKQVYKPRHRHNTLETSYYVKGNVPQGADVNKSRQEINRDRINWIYDEMYKKMVPNNMSNMMLKLSNLGINQEGPGSQHMFGPDDKSGADIICHNAYQMTVDTTAYTMATRDEFGNIVNDSYTDGYEGQKQEFKDELLMTNLENLLQKRDDYKSRELFSDKSSAVYTLLKSFVLPSANGQKPMDILLGTGAITRGQYDFMIQNINTGFIDSAEYLPYLMGAYIDQLECALVHMIGKLKDYQAKESRINGTVIPEDCRQLLSDVLQIISLSNDKVKIENRLKQVFASQRMFCNVDFSGIPNFSAEARSINATNALYTNRPEPFGPYGEFDYKNGTPEPEDPFGNIGFTRGVVTNGQRVLASIDPNYNPYEVKQANFARGGEPVPNVIANLQNDPNLDTGFKNALLGGGADISVAEEKEINEKDEALKKAMKEWMGTIQQQNANKQNGFNPNNQAQQMQNQGYGYNPQGQYQNPQPGYQAPMNNGYQNPGYNPQANAGYQAPMNNGYNPQVNPGYQVPVNNGYNPQNQGYVNQGYQVPQAYNANAGYQNPQPGYVNPNQGYQNQSQALPGYNQGTIDTSSLQGYGFSTPVQTTDNSQSYTAYGTPQYDNGGGVTYAGATPDDPYGFAHFLDSGGRASTVTQQPAQNQNVALPGYNQNLQAPVNNGYQNPQPGYVNPNQGQYQNPGYQVPQAYNANAGYNPNQGYTNPGYQVPVNNGYNPQGQYQNQGYVNPGYQNPQPQYQQGYNPNQGYQQPGPQQYNANAGYNPQPGYQAPVNNGYGYNPQPQNQGGGIIPEDNTYSALISQRNQDLGRMQNNGMYR